MNLIKMFKVSTMRPDRGAAGNRFRADIEEQGGARRLPRPQPRKRGRHCRPRHHRKPFGFL